MNTIRRAQASELRRRLLEPRRFLQVVSGPRQVGKTTMVRQVLGELPLPSRYASADEPGLRGAGWVAEQWELGRLLAREGEAVLALDEIQKVPGWSETVKRLWDEDGRSGLPLKVVLLGSAPLLVGRGLTESLAGRFERIVMTHWSYAEMREAFGWDLERFLFFGGYPGAAPLAEEEPRWRRYVLDSLVETTVSRDVLLMHRVDKPALLRRLLELACRYSGQVLSYNKMLGQLQDAGNTTTLAHYLDLLAGAGMVAGLQKYAGQAVRRRASSPKLQVFTTALHSAVLGTPREQLRRQPEAWGRLVESAVGAHLLAAASRGTLELHYWRAGAREVDFVVRCGERLTAIEVKSAARTRRPAGLQAFCKAFPEARPLLVGEGGLSLEQFLLEPAERWC